MAIFTVYQLNEYNVSQVYVAARFGAWNGVADFLTLIFAFLADAYIGKFVTIVLGSFATLLLSRTNFYYITGVLIYIFHYHCL